MPCPWLTTTIALGSTGFGVWQGMEAGDAAQDAADEQQRAMNAQQYLSEQQWVNYRDNYEPVLREIIDQAQAPEDMGYHMGQAAAGVTQDLSDQRGALQQVASQAGRSMADPTIARQNALMGASAGIQQGAAQNAMRQALDTQDWERLVGTQALGRGMPANLMAGYASVANQLGREAEQQGQAAGQWMSTATQLPNLLQGLGGGNN